MHGIFSIFKKKPAPQAVVVKSSTREETSPTRHESFCNVDELIHTEPEVKPIYISEEPKSRKSTYASEAPKSRKKYAAPAAPEPPKQETVEVVKVEEPKLDTENSTNIEPPRYDERYRSPSPEPNRVSETVQEALETKMEVENHPGQKKSEVPGTYGVIHYTPQSTIRSSTKSLERIGDDSDVPYVERKSNITLSGKLKTIPVSQFDGTIGRQQRKEAAPAPPPPALPSSPPPSLYGQHQFNDSAVVPDTNTVSSEQMWENNRSVRDAAATMGRNSPAPYRTDSNGSSGTAREVEVASDMNLSYSERMDNNEMMQEISTSDDTTYDDDMIEAAEITREFETLKVKFERWKALQAANRNSAEARQLHMEIMHQNDTLMKKLQQTTDMAGHTGRNRPVISPETFLPWNERSRSSRQPSSPRTAPVSEIHRRPALPNRWTPAPSMHSLSPATSTSSEETDRSQHYDGRRSQAVATDRYSSAGINRPAQNVPQSSDSDERERARLRIVQEANEQRRKEQELRSTIGYTKESRLMATTSRHNDQYRRNYTPSTLPKNYHARTSSDGNNNAFGAQKFSGSIYQGRQPAPIPQAARQFQPSPVPKNVNSHYARGTFNGTLHSSLISLKANNDEAMRIESSPSPSPQPSPIPNRMSPLPEGEVTQPVNPSATLNPPMNNRAPSAPDLSGNNNNSKFSPSMVKRNASPFEEKRENKSMAPLTPNAGSNIRKVKEAVKQQSLSQKTAAKLLLQKQTTTHTPLSEVTKGFDKERVNANNNKSKESPKLGRNNNTDNASTVSEGEISNNIAKVLKEGLSTLKKTAPPVEKSGIALGRVVETNRLDDSSRTRYDGGVGQQTRPYASSPVATHSTKPTPTEPAYAPPPPAPAPPPPAPAPPPPAPAPPAPPPPPPANLMGSSTKRISSQPPSSQRGLENQRSRSAPAMNVTRGPMPDVRDSLMAEIRNAGGIRALRKVSRQH